MKEHFKVKVNKLLSTFCSAMYFGFMLALTLITISLVFQQIISPNNIPHIFGYKMFMIMDEYMTDELEKGDLVITKNVLKENYQVEDTMAFRNSSNLVTIHKIRAIDENEGKFSYQMYALENETSDTKIVTEDNIEGKMVAIIPYIGLILLYMQMPLVMAGIVLTILICGAIALWIAKRLDARDIRIIENQQKETSKTI